MRLSSAKTGALFIVFIFILSRLAFYALGVRFIYAGAIESLPQLLSIHLLRGDLWRSLFYLHAQPPLFNLFTGIVLQLFPGYEALAFEVIYQLIGLGLGLGLYLLMVRLNVPPWLSILLTNIYCIGPSAVYYENTLNYEYPVALLLVLSALALSEAISAKAPNSARRKILRYTIFFSLLACIVLTRTTFQVVWLLATVALLLLLQQAEWKHIMLAAGIPIFVVLLWYAKNLALFGEFSTSSWLGMNFSRITMYCIPEEWRIALVDQHEISELGRLRSIYDYPLQDHQEIQWGIPALDDVYKQDSINDYNFNNINLIPASRQFMQDSLYVFNKYRRDYIYCVLYAQYTYFSPPFSYDDKWQRAPLLKSIESAYSHVLYTSWVGDLDFLTHHHREDVRAVGKWLTSSTFLFLGYFLSFVALIVLAVRAILQKDPSPGLNRTVLIYILFTLLYITAVSTLVDIGENNRFRVMADPLFVTALGVGISQLLKRLPTR